MPFLNSFSRQNKTHVIEFYSYSDEYSREQITHEVISGANAGSILSAIYGQNIRFVYAPDNEKYQLVLKEAETRGYKQTIINLYEPNQLHHLLSRIKPGDSILINGQGDIDKELIAGRDAEELTDILLDEFRLKDIQLNNLDIDSCLMGRVESYRNVLKSLLKNFQTITTYTELCSVSSGGDQLFRMWIKKKSEGYSFYKEDEINGGEIRITEYTDFYRALLKESWKPNPNNSDEIDISDCMNLSW
ncbi:hypothetical protein [Legionella maioricensis]|uniref:Uncharacterized protein n=1 Tax=Legionella maioricensis TaxID=2896528 RepID=A0A9X2D3Y8_9GAMM|nr:hypothetical protein [Legionella maioricensis]MCL9685605.1 hypothetical protein [Legionella maioricensis]MCL9689014.1 hypothetical protein [Legionella maioricensis]